jgi:ABC-2 type transport system permease protein
MMTLSQNLPALLEIARTRLRIAYTYRVNVIFATFLTGLQIYLLTVVWKAAYGGRTEVDGIAIEQLLVYLTLANLQLRFLRPEMDFHIQQRIREGQIGFDLSRPVGYPSQLMAGAVGEMVGLLPFLVVAFPVALIAGELTAPASVEAGFGYAAALFLAWIVAALLVLLIGLVSFWTLEMNGFRMIYTLVGNFATGALVPLWFMPDALRAVIQLLPFQAIAFVPVSIYVGAPATGAIWSSLLLQAAWVGILILVIRWVWSKAFRHTVIQGG